MTTTDSEPSPKAAKEESSEDDHVDWEGLRRRSVLPGGFGHERVSIWPRLLRVKPTAPPRDDDNDEPAHADEYQIRLDTERSFVFYPVGSMNQRYALQAQLHDLLVRLFRRRRLLSYFQGYHDIITVLLLTLPAPLLLPCTEKLSLYRLRDSMGKGLEPVLGLLRVLSNLLSLADPSYAALLEQTSPLPYYALSNLLTLFAHDMPTLPLIQHVFDWMLCRPPLCVVYLGAAIILSRKAEVERLEEEGEEGMVHSLLSGLPELWDGDEEEQVKEEKVDVEREVKIEEESVNLEELEEEKVPIRHTPDDPTNEEETILPAPALSPTPSSSSISISTSTSTLTPATDSEHITTAKAESNVDHGELESSQSAPASVLVFENGDMDGQVELSSSFISEEEGTLNSSHTLTHSLSPSPSLSRPTSPSPFTRPKRTPKIPLTALLTHADELYATYPPSHPSLRLSEIMGPQSVVFTWSEGGAGGEGEEGDDEAESIVLHPELIVLPYLEPSLPSPPSSSEEEEEKKPHSSKPSQTQTKNNRNPHDGSPAKRRAGPWSLFGRIWETSSSSWWRFGVDACGVEEIWSWAGGCLLMVLVLVVLSGWGWIWGLITDLC